MGKLDGRVALVTGAARGQGRAEAVRFAEEGADIIAVDVCARVTSTEYAPATPEDLQETVALVEKLGRRIVAAEVDVRDLAALEKAVKNAVAELGGRLDVVMANAGVCTWARFWEMPTELWREMIDINLSGTYHTLRVAAPIMIEAGNGGSIIATSSAAGIKALPGQAHYSAAKHGIVGLVKSAAQELAPYKIRVNSIHPAGVDTHMATMGPEVQKLMFEDNPTFGIALNQIITDPPLSQPEDIAEAALFLATESSRTITASQLTVDHGATKV